MRKFYTWVVHHTTLMLTVFLLAVSLDYSVFLLHRFEECQKDIPDVREAMLEALCKSTSSIASSGLTTVIGFLALVFMRFRIGPDLGLALAKGAAISLITVFLFMPSLLLKAEKLRRRLRHRSFVPDFTRFGKVVRHAMLPLVIVFLLVMVPSYLASNSNSFYYGSSYIFGPETQLGADTEEIEEVFGKQETFVLMVPKGSLPTQKALSEELNTLPQITDIISYVDTVGMEVPKEYLDEEILSMLESEHYSRMVITAETEPEGDDTFALIEQIRVIADSYLDESVLLVFLGSNDFLYRLSDHQFCSVGCYGRLCNSDDRPLPGKSGNFEQKECSCADDCVGNRIHYDFRQRTGCGRFSFGSFLLAWNFVPVGNLPGKRRLHRRASGRSFWACSEDKKRRKGSVSQVAEKWKFVL